jgi:hypothetical protein
MFTALRPLPVGDRDKDTEILVRPDTVLRCHRDLVRKQHAARSRTRRPGRPRIARSVRALVLRMVRENPGYGCRRRVHGALPLRSDTATAIPVLQVDRSSPVLAVRVELEVPAEQRMKPVRHPHTSIPIISTGCS